jgi:hypothetical protein
MKKTSKLRTALKITIVVLFTALAAVQFVPARLNQSDAVLETDFIRTFKPPQTVETILRASCYDCHSNNTNYPWYNRLQPAAWFMEGHITAAKDELNFSEFGSYSKRRQKSKLRSVISEVNSGAMPLPSYTYIHWDAVLSDTEKKEIETWVTGLRNSPYFE